MKRKQPKSGTPDPSRFAVGAEGIEPMRQVGGIDMLTEEQKLDNVAHAEALRRAFEDDDEG